MVWGDFSLPRILPAVELLRNVEESTPSVLREVML
jgi:hypothetical protein